ncbi:OB-fold domain-containing protein [Pseudofrankia sp. BMG5.36]|uniref:Zn-ribbon domain-containing OB-fold protein n=1 Tax=Pseudofrankia sp. BMG5.36 TaxID=1834512 RepID=UPI000AF3B9D9|nr:OB-fold domain-containing protein [Pseudofrankia sp. BMG5.36]
MSSGARSGPRIVTNTVEFPYRRSLGPVIGTFVAALARGQILGVRSGERVLCPPLEYDPDTGAATSGEFVAVGPVGTVRSWTWVSEPNARHPLDRPFAFALIQLDGAGTSLLHAVDAGGEGEGAMRTGLRVVPRFRAEPKGRTDDLAYFVPEGAETTDPGVVDGATLAAVGGEPRAPLEPVETMEFWSSLTYKEALSAASERYARSLLAGRLLGQRCPTCAKVYVPPRDFCAIDGIPLNEGDDLALPDRGVITNFTIVTPVKYPGQKETEPFVRVSVLLDEVDAPVGQRAGENDLPSPARRPGSEGAEGQRTGENDLPSPVRQPGSEGTEGQRTGENDLPSPVRQPGSEGAMMGLQPVVDVSNEEVRVGMRVEAVWLPEAERNADELGNRGWGSASGAITGWRPTGEPDLPVERYIDRVF